MRIIYCERGHRVVVDETLDVDTVDCQACLRMIESKVFKAKRSGES